MSRTSSFGIVTKSTFTLHSWSQHALFIKFILFSIFWQEVRLAIEYIVIPGGEAVELLPRRSEIIARQLELVESYQLAAENSGTELNPRLQILPVRLNKKSSSKSVKHISSLLKVTDPGSLTSAGGGTSVTKLPLLPDK